ncbi:SCO4225 family membrane protein [Streptomyces beigongshangae]|uniref:SCO4225 family membrane protein n=1 Tax=Streptomyces beigongshangae TaxID=2841597 RepID=UPI0027E076E5|nr:hypothetical protein [Streptomyces sp. REN17]
MSSKIPTFVRTLPHRLGYLLSDLFALSYLGLCTVLLGWALLENSDGSMAGVIPLFATAPTSIVPLLLLPDGSSVFLVSIVLGALVNTVVIGWCARTLRHGRTPDPVS